MLTREYKSPCGRLLLGVHGSGLCLCDWMVDGRIESSLRRLRKYMDEWARDDGSVLERAAACLDEYFAGEREEFDIPLLMWGTPFQMQVWQALMAVPYGTTVPYLRMARDIGRPSAVRAVANAIGTNPVSVIVPCHRVVGGDGSLTGYAGGLEAKQYLLDLEKGGTAVCVNCH